MAAQENMSGGVRPNLFPLQTSALPQGSVSQMPIVLVDPNRDHGQSSAHSSPLHALPTPPYSSWGARTISPSSINSSSRTFAPSAASAASQVSRGPAMGYGGPERRQSTGTASFPSSVTFNAPMSSNNMATPSLPSDHGGSHQKHSGQQHDPRRYSSQTNPDLNRQYQIDTQQRAAPRYMSTAQQPVQPQGWQQSFSDMPAPAFPHPSRRVSLPSTSSTQPHSSPTAMIPDNRPNPARSGVPAQPTQNDADSSGRRPTSATAAPSRSSVSSSHPYASPHAPSPTVPTAHGRPPQQYPTQTNQQYPISQMYSQHPSGGYAQGGQPVRLQPQPQQPQTQPQTQQPQPQTQQSTAQPAGATQAQQQHSQQYPAPRPLPNDHPAVQHSHKLVRTTGLYLERAYNAAIYTVSNELDRLDAQFRALKADHQRVSGLYQQAEQEKTVLREDRTKILSEFIKEREAHERSKADLAQAMSAGTQLMDIVRTRAEEYEKMKTDLERSEKEHAVLAKSLGERFQSSAAGSPTDSGRETVDMVQVGRWQIPKALVSVLEDAVKGPLIQQYEQRFGEVLAGQARERAEHEKEIALLRALLPTSTQMQSRDNASTLASPVHPATLPPSAHAPRPPSAQAQAQPSQHPQPTHPPQRLHSTPEPQSTLHIPSTPHLHTAPGSSAPTPTSDALAARLSSTPLSLGPSLSRRREHLPLPISHTQRPGSASTSTDDHSGSIPTPPRTATPSTDIQEPSIFAIVKQEPVDAPSWPWLPGEVIDLTEFNDPPSANLPPLHLDLNRLKAQLGGGGDAMNVDRPQSPVQSERQSAPPDQPERKRSLSAQADSDVEGSRKRMKMDHSEDEEDAVMEELMEQTSSEIDELVEAPEPDPPLTSSPEAAFETPAASSPHAPRPCLPESLDPHATTPASGSLMTIEEPAAPLPSSSNDLQADPPVSVPIETVPPEPESSNVPLPVTPSRPEASFPSENLFQTISTTTAAELQGSAVKPEPQDLSSLAAALSLPQSPKLSIRHLDLVYHTDRDKVIMSCRMCLARKEMDPVWPVKRFPIHARWQELSGHCKDVHPRAYQELVVMPDSKVQETRQRLISGGR